MSTKPIHERIAEAGRKKNLTTREVARLAGISQAHYVDITSGKKRLSIATAAKLCPVLGLKARPLLREQFEAELAEAGVE